MASIDPVPVPPGLLLIDGSNVRRSGWPNASEAELVRALDTWTRAAIESGTDVVVVFDGHARVEPTDRVDVVCVPYADDELVSRARARVEQGAQVRAATSDRELRARLEQAGAEIPWGGGSLLRELGFGRRR